MPKVPLKILLPSMAALIAIGLLLTGAIDGETVTRWLEAIYADATEGGE